MNNTTPPESRISPSGSIRFDGLDGLRAGACMGIAAMHVLSNIEVKPAECWIISRVIPWFTNFTLLFFIISAFSMCCGYYTRVKEQRISPNDFYKKRYSKILPFFAFLVIIDLIMEHTSISLAQGFADVTLTFGLMDYDIEVIGVGWFLGTIFVFYMIFPWFVFLMDNKVRAWIAFVLAIVMQMLMSNVFEVGSRTNVLWSMPYFCCGGLLYLYRMEIVKFASKLQWLMLGICILSTAAFHLFPTRSTLPEMALFVLWIVYAISAKDKILKNRVTSFISGISMEIYLCHMVMFRVVEKCHLEQHIENRNMLYVVTLVLVLMGAVLFSYAFKRGYARIINYAHNLS